MLPEYYRPMGLHFREDKTTQAAARLIQHAGGAINHMKLIKLLYLAERRALLTFGRPITFDSYVSMPHGPVLSFTLDKINESVDPEHESYWHRFISERSNHEVRLIRAAPNDQLSPVEENVLDGVWEEFGQMDQWQLRDYCHDFLPEWQDPHGSSLPIAIRDILRVEGRSEDEAREIEETLEGEAIADEFAAE